MDLFEYWEIHGWKQDISSLHLLVLCKNVYQLNIYQFMNPSDYYYNKFIEWQGKANGDYRNYLNDLDSNKQERRAKLASEFRSDKVGGKGFQLVCQYLNTYAKGKEKESIMTIIEGIADPERDILEILIGATLDACDISEVGNSLIGLAIAGLVGAGLIALLASLGKKR